MRCELTDYERAAIKPMPLHKPRSVPRVHDRRILNGIFWLLRSGAPWRAAMFLPPLSAGNWPGTHSFKHADPAASRRWVPHLLMLLALLTDRRAALAWF